MLCVSADVCRTARRRAAPTGRLIVFPNAINTEYFRPATDEERVAARAALALPPGRPVLLHFGWDWERKGGDVFLATVDTLTRGGLDVQALCVGGGQPARAAIDRLDLDDRARVLEPQEDVRMLYAAADIFVSPSRAEGMPYAALEALCTGTPVIASDIPGHLSLAQLTRRCVLAGCNAQAFAQAVRSLLTAAPNIEPFATSVDLRAWAQHLIELYARDG